MVAHLKVSFKQGVASLTVPGGQEFPFLHFPSNFDQVFLFFLKLFLFSSSLWLSGWASRPPGREGPGYATAFKHVKSAILSP